MGIPGWCLKQLRRRYPAAFSKAPPERVPMCVIDAMQYVKVVPADTHTVAAYVAYMVRMVRWQFVREKRRVVVVCVDRGAPPVKRIMCYKDRYGGSREQPFGDDEGPFLHKDGLLPEQWGRFAGNRRLLQRELFPRLYNAFISMGVPAGCSLLLHGFPGRVERVRVYDGTPAWENERNVWAQQRLVDRVDPWPEERLPLSKRDEQADPELYQRVFIVENIAPCPEFPAGAHRVQECAEERNAIPEADLAVFRYDRCYPMLDQLIVTNDGDAYPTALLYAADRVVNNEFRNRQFLRLPIRKKKKVAKGPRFRYVDVNRLVIEMRSDGEFGRAGVQNHEATWAMLLALDKTDFFRGHLKGIGVERVAWPVFFEKLPMFSHLVQFSKNILPCVRTPRRLVIDEELWRLFVHYCYLQKYSAGIRRKRRRADKEKRISYRELRLRCANTAKGTPQVDEGMHLPDRNTVRRWGRQLLWNLLYWANGMRGKDAEPDPFEQYEGASYFGFRRDPLGLAPGVSARQKPVDEVYSRHFYRTSRRELNRARKRPRSPPELSPELEADIDEVFPQ